MWRRAKQIRWQWTLRSKSINCMIVVVDRHQPRQADLDGWHEPTLESSEHGRGVWFCAVVVSSADAKAIQRLIRRHDRPTGGAAGSTRRGMRLLKRQHEQTPTNQFAYRIHHKIGKKRCTLRQSANVLALSSFARVWQVEQNSSTSYLWPFEERYRLSRLICGHTHRYRTKHEPTAPRPKSVSPSVALTFSNLSTVAAAFLKGPPAVNALAAAFKAFLRPYLPLLTC
jgi:hypothetical protein